MPFGSQNSDLEPFKDLKEYTENFIDEMLKGLIYKNLQIAAEGGMAPRQMVPTAIIWYAPSPQLLYPPRPHI